MSETTITAYENGGVALTVKDASQLASERLGLLSEMAQVQRRNAELAMGFYTFMGGGSKTEPDRPVFPDTFREMSLGHCVDALQNIQKINAELLKLL